LAIVRSQTPNKKASWLLERVVRNLLRKTTTCFSLQVLMKQQIYWDVFLSQENHVLNISSFIDKINLVNIEYKQQFVF